VKIQFKDFVPEAKDAGGIFRSATYEHLSEPLGGANEWISNNGIEVINIETVALPNIYNSGEEGSTDPHLRSSAEYGTYWHQFIRVWYRSGS
jgi:hypothetical protein